MAPGESAPAKRPVSVLVVVHTRQFEVLLLERASHPGFWQSVTGSQENGETIRDTALREIAEETGLNADSYRLTGWNLSNRFEIFPQWRHRYSPGITHNIEHVFSLELDLPLVVTLSPEEHLSQAWLPLAQAAERVFSWTNRDAIVSLALQRR